MNTLGIALGAIVAVSACSSGSGENGAGGHGAGTTGSMASGQGTSTGSTGGGSSGPGLSNETVIMTGTGGSGTLVGFGTPYTGGQYNLGPVDYAETMFHNACAPSTKYPAAVQQAEGNLLAGLWNGIADVAGYCDACIWVTTGKGKSALLRVVTYGQTSTNSIDVSPQAYQILDAGEYPRTMTWQFAECASSGPMMYEFQTGSSQWWTSLWVRNARVPLSSVEVQSVNHPAPAWVALDRASDGTLTDAAGFGMGSFSIRSTGVDGQQVVDTFDWPSAGIAGAFLTGTGNFE